MLDLLYSYCIVYIKGVQLRDLHTGWATSPQHRHRRRQTPLRLREDPQIYYAENLRQSVDNDIRYRRTPREQQSYKEVLGKALIVSLIIAGL